MTKRVFLCTDSDYPKLDASSNYVSNLSKAFRLSGYEVFVVSLDRSGVEDHVWKKNNDDINYCRIKYCDTYRVAVAGSRVNGARRLLKALRQKGCNSDDRIVIYLNKWYLAAPVANWARKNKITVWATVVEWFEQDSFNQNACFRSFAKCDGVIAISKSIEVYFSKKGIRTIIIPPLVDMSQREEYKTRSFGDGKVHFLYTGSFVGKDDMKVMLEAIALLPEDKRRLIEYNITRYNDESLVRLSGINEETWNTIRNNVVTHGDVTNEQLKDLLEKSDFLTIARQNNRTTISNFPSKVPEAMAYGVVPIMTRVGDCPNDYLTDEVDSIIFDNCSSEECSIAYLRAIKGAQTDFLSTMKTNAYESAKRQFDVECYASKLAEI